jgi:hypothetical protein
MPRPSASATSKVYNREKLLGMTAGGEELEKLAVELELIPKRDTGRVGAIEHHVAEVLGLKEKKTSTHGDGKHRPGHYGTFGRGRARPHRTAYQQGSVHLVLFLVYIVLIFSP